MRWETSRLRRLLFCLAPVGWASIVGAATAAGPGGPILDAADFRLADFQNRVMVLGIGAIGCERSEEGLAHLQKLHLSNRDGLAPAFVFAGQNRAEIEAYRRTHPLDYPLVGDPGKIVSTRFRSGAIPTFFLLGKWGEVRYRGPWPAERIDDMLATLLAEKPGAEKAFFETKALRAGQTALPFALSDLAGKPLDLKSALKDSKLLLVVFGNDVCPFSRKAYSELNALGKNHREAGLRLAVVHIGKPTQAAKDLYASLRIECPVGIDADEKVADSYGIQAVPTAYLIKPDGKIYYQALFSPQIDKIAAAYLGLSGEKPSVAPVAPAAEGAVPGG